MDIRVILTSSAGTMALTATDTPELRDTLKVVWRRLEDQGEGSMQALPVDSAKENPLEARVDDDRGELPYTEARRALRQWVGLPDLVGGS